MKTADSRRTGALADCGGPFESFAVRCPPWRGPPMRQTDGRSPHWSSSPGPHQRPWQAQTQAAAPGSSPIVIVGLARSPSRRVGPRGPMNTPAGRRGPPMRQRSVRSGGPSPRLPAAGALAARGSCPCVRAGGRCRAVGAEKVLHPETRQRPPQPQHNAERKRPVGSSPLSASRARCFNSPGSNRPRSARAPLPGRGSARALSAPS